MDNLPLAAGPITWPGLLTCLVALWGVTRAVDWALGKLKAGTKDAVNPLAISVEALKLDIRQVDEKLSAFKIEVARTYATNEVITRLERRIDDMVTSVREEMKETRDTMIRAFTSRRPSD